MARLRVYLTQPIAQQALVRLRAAAEVEMNADPLHMVSREELVAGVRGADVLFCLLHDRVDAGVLEANPRLGLVASMAITPANVDVAAATTRGIPVTVIPPLVTEATADVAFALLDRKSTRLNSSHTVISYAVFCLKKKKLLY